MSTERSTAEIVTELQQLSICVLRELANAHDRLEAQAARIAELEEKLEGWRDS